MASTTPRFSVKPGLCQSTESGVSSKCWLSSDQCSGTWVSGMEMLLSMGGGPFTNCILHGTLQDMPVGQCGVSTNGGREDIICSPNPESCSPSTKTSTSVSFSDWTVTSTDECIVKDTHFGSCNGDDGTVCRYSPEQCPDSPDSTVGGVDWTFPHEACSCDRVQVGACHNSKEDIAVCAVNEQACSVTMASVTTWIPVENVLSTLGYECFLCREPSQEEVPILDAGVPSSPSTSNMQSSSSGSKKANTVIVGSAIGGVVVAMLFLAMALFIRRQRQSASWMKTLEQQQEPSSALPPKDVVFGSNDNGMAFDSHQGDSTLDADDVSVL